MIARFLLVLTCALGMAFAAAAQDEEEFVKPLVGAGLDRYAIDISTGFSGTDVLLYGALEEPADIIVVVTGKPPGEVEVRRKDRIAGLWINRARVRFGNVPTFYGIAATRPIEDILDPRMLERLEIGTTRLKLAAIDGGSAPEAFREALLRIRTERGFFTDDIGHVAFGAGSKLFEAHLKFPAAVPPGIVLVSVHVVKNGRIVDGTTLPVAVRKIGMSADIYLFAQNNARAYGLIAVFTALIAGWIAHLVFRRR